MIRYNELAKVSAVETIQNELVVSKWVEGRFISVPEKVPGTANHFGPRKSAWHCKSSANPSANPCIKVRGNELDNPNGVWGPKHNVFQIFTWSEVNPCAQH